jgi:ParB family chromosome partitioning protein
MLQSKQGFGSNNTYNKAKFISENADDDMIKSLDEGKLSINKAYITLKQRNEEVIKENKNDTNQEIVTINGFIKYTK